MIRADAHPGAIRAPANSPPRDERMLRHPWERSVFVLSVSVNAVILIGAIVLVAVAPTWLQAHPDVSKRAAQLRVLAIAALFGGPATVLVRNTRWAQTHWSGLRVSATQFPELHAILERHCAVLGIASLPLLYISDREKQIARAYTAWSTCYIVLSSRLLQPDITPIRDAVAFHIAREIGRIRLGHTVWWDEMLLSYIVQIPYLRNPLSRIRAFSADRYGAYLEPDGVRGLIAIATGRLILPSVNVDAYLHQLETATSWSQRLGSYNQPLPPIGLRVRVLYELGLFRSPAGPPPSFSSTRVESWSV